MMLDLNELEQFVTFAKYGTLSKTPDGYRKRTKVSKQP